VGDKINPAMVQGSSLWPVTPLDGAQFGKEVQALLNLYHPAVRTGEFVTLYGKERIYAMARHQGDDKLVVIFNVGQMPEEVTVPVGELLPDNAVLHDVWKGHRYEVQEGMLRAAVLPRSAVVLAAGG
jgi:hypothetical protein